MIGLATFDPFCDLIAAATERLLSPNELWTLGGAVTAVVVITNGLYYAFAWPPRVLGLVLSIVIAAGATIASGEYSWERWAVAIPNGFIIYTSAVGVSSIASAGARQGAGKQRHSETEELGAPKRPFLCSWF